MNPSSSAQEPPRQARGAEREQAILEATMQLIGEVGYERVTTDAIAARAHASKATMYRRWGGKADLVADALRRRSEGEAPEVPDTGALRSDLLIAVAQIADSLAGRDGPSLIGLVEGIRDDAALRDIVDRQVRARSLVVGRAICAQAVSRGEVVRPGGPDLVMGVAFAQLLREALFSPAGADEARWPLLVDEVLVPLVRG